MADTLYKEAYRNQQETIERNAAYTKKLEDEILLGNARLEEAIEDYKSELEEKEQVIHRSAQRIRQLQKAEVTKDKKELETTLADLKKKCTEETEVLGNRVNELADRLSDQREKNTQLVRQLEEASEQGVGKSATGPGQFDYPSRLATVQEQNQDLRRKVDAMKKQLKIIEQRETDLKSFYSAVKDVRDVQELVNVYSKRFPESKANFVGEDIEVYFDASNGQ